MIKRNIDLRVKKKNNKIGSALAETILVTAILVFIIVVVFFPSIMSIFQNAIKTLETWFVNAANVIS